MEGYVKLHRKILEWEWISDDNVFRLFAWLLLKANIKEKKWRGIVIKRGQLFTSRKSIAEELKISIQQIRTATDKLISTEEILVESTNKGLLITISNYDTYQDAKIEKQQSNNNQITDSQQSNNNQSTTTKEEKEEEERKNKIIDPQFLCFFETYHRLSGKPKTDQKAAYNHWQKMSKKDKQSAIDKIELYVDSISDSRYIKKARTYLRDKNYEDEFKLVNGINNNHEVKYYELYRIPSDDFFTYPEEKILERCNQGMYPKKMNYA